MDCSTKGGMHHHVLCFSFQNLAARSAATAFSLGSATVLRYSNAIHVVGSNMGILR